MLRLLLVAALAIVLVDPQIAQAQEPEKAPTAVGRGGAAATVDALGTEAAIRVLRRGGNAVDAAVAAAAVLGVTEPFSCGIGGGGFMVIRTPGGKVTTIDSREESPSAMQPDSFIEDGTPLTLNEARYSGLSAGVPGTVAGWERALRRYGSWSLRRALRPGIEVARDGFTVDPTFVSQIVPNIDWFDDIPSSAELYLDDDGTARDEGDTLVNRDLARTYRLIADRGARGFYRGELARAMADAAQDPPTAPDANHAWRPGLMTAKDVKRYEALERRPTRIGYRGLDVWGMGPPSSGGSTVGEALNILEGYPDLDDPDRTRALHLFLEASRFAFADRNAFLADPDFFDVPLAGLLSDEYAAERRELIDEEHAATSPVEPGDPNPYSSTTHLVVSDRHGTVVSYTFTIESTRRRRHRRPRLRLPAQQRADRLQLRRRQATRTRPTATSARAARSARPSSPATEAGAGGRFARRLDDHHHRAAGAAGATRPRRHPPRSDREPQSQPAQHGGDQCRAGVHRVARGTGAEFRLRPPGVHRGGRDRRGDGTRVPAPRPHARGGRAGAPWRRERRGRGSLMPRGRARGRQTALS